MPTVDTSKYFMQKNDMKTDNAPCIHRNTKEGKLLLSIQSYNSCFRFLKDIRRERMTEHKPLTKVNCIILTAGFNPNRALLVYKLMLNKTVWIK